MRIPLQNRHPIIQLLAFFGLALASFILVMVLGAFAGMLIWGSDFILSAADPESPQYVPFMKYWQILSHFGMFIIPALIFGRLAGGKTLSYFTLNKGASLWLFLLSMIVILSSQPLISWMGELNAGLTLTERFAGLEAWMKQTEQQAADMTILFMSTSDVSGLLVNLFMMAVIPAIGEELAFRGILQRLLQNLFRRPWIAILLSAVIFSAFHLQFYGFLPRLFLGLILGYTFYRTGRLWVPILIHFVNNAMAVTVYWLCARGTLTIAPEQFGNFNDKPLVIVIAIITMTAALMLLNMSSKKLPETTHE